jgi:hypothetical protein
MKPVVGMRFVSVMLIVIMLAPMFSMAINVSEILDWNQYVNANSQSSKEPIDVMSSLYMDYEQSTNTGFQDYLKPVPLGGGAGGGGAGAGGEDVFSGSHWCIVDFLCDSTGYNMPSQLWGEFVAVQNSMVGLQYGSDWHDGIIYLPLNVAFGTADDFIQGTAVWFQFGIEFQPDQQVGWNIWNSIGGWNNEWQYSATPITIPYIPGDRYNYEITTSGTNTVEFKIINLDTGALFTNSEWEYTVPTLDMTYDQGAFSPACAIEGYTSSSELGSVPLFQTWIGSQITGHFRRDFPSEDAIPVGINTFMTNINNDMRFWGMINDANSLPSPTIDSVVYPTIVDVDQPITIDVTVKNTGGYAAWQTISISFPSFQQVTDITILESNLPSTIISPQSGPGYYFYSTFHNYYAENYIIEGVTDWSNGAIHHLKISVMPTTSQPFVFYVKSVAAASNWATNWDPGIEDSGSSDYQTVVDSQLEYVRSYTVEIGSTPSHFPSSISLYVNT